MEKKMTRNISIKRVINILMNKDADETEDQDSELLYVPLSQHIGSPAIPVVEIGDYVKKYEKIGESSGVISANIHSPVSGDIADIVEHSLPNGNKVKTVIIANDFQNKQEKLVKRELNDLKLIKKEEIFSIIKEAGIVELGGAQFPTHEDYLT